MSLDSRVEIPVVLFAYARPVHLARVLTCLRENQVPLLYVYADGTKGRSDTALVEETRAMLRRIDWCEVRLTERPNNLGLGQNVLAGVTEVAAQHEAFIVWEDDLICVPGTYAWMTAALRHYANDERVMSVSGWTHPRVTPSDVGEQPYFDGRADCWVWGGYARSWRGMTDETALQKMCGLISRGLAADAYGADLPKMAETELRKNIWAVRWLYHHLQHGGLCLRPPWSMVEHIGFDQGATNAASSLGWAHRHLRPSPPAPRDWPVVAEHPEPRKLWTEANRVSVRDRLKALAKKVVPSVLLAPLVRRFFRIQWKGNYADWTAAQADATGYADDVIVAKVVESARQVIKGQACYEQDGVAFRHPAPWWPGIELLQAAVRPDDGGLAVLDFGGSLGSQYFQARRYLKVAGRLHWRVVEQAGFVEAGRREFQTDELRFFLTIEKAIESERPDVLLLSSVLPYLAAPLETLKELCALEVPWMVVERTAFVESGPSRLTMQHVPRSIYPARYPCWFLNREEFLATLGSNYRLVHEHRDPIDTPSGLEFRSLHFARVTP